MNGIPSIKITCSCGHEWLQAMAPWAVSWSAWEETRCAKCQKPPQEYVWHGVDAFTNSLQDTLYNKTKWSHQDEPSVKKD